MLESEIYSLPFFPKLTTLKGKTIRDALHFVCNFTRSTSKQNCRKLIVSVSFLRHHYILEQQQKYKNERIF